MTAAQWVKYDGSDEQIAEMKASRDVIIRFKSSYELLRSSCFVDDFNDRLAYGTVTHYLICNPHPYADMICRWARTGQPVYWKSKVSGWTGLCHEYFPPFMHPVDFEYSFTSFEERKECEE